MTSKRSFTQMLMCWFCLFALYPYKTKAFSERQPHHPSLLVVRNKNKKPSGSHLYSSSTDKKGYQSYGEESRRFRRTYYNHDSWLKHRSQDRFLSNLASILQSGVTRQVGKEVGIVVTIATISVLWNSLLVTGYVDFDQVHHDALIASPLIPRLALPLQPFTISSPALGLLLVFRTNTSYGRWNEARKAWGAIVNHSRNLVRLASAWSTEDVCEQDRKQALHDLGMAVWAFSRSLQRHLLGQQDDDDDYSDAVTSRLPPEMASGLLEARHKPTRALFELSHAINQLPMTYLRRMEVDRSVVALCDAMGACERIFSSPVPLVYTRHTARFLGGWILGLPLALWAPFEMSWNHWGVIPASALIAFFFFGIEEFSVQLEEPFSILPLQNLVDGIELSAEEHVAWHLEHEQGAKTESTTATGRNAFLEQDWQAELRGEAQALGRGRNNSHL